jgi:FKBP-type peptidyl-prolyl cis-trans isomerase FkpA
MRLHTFFGLVLIGAVVSACQGHPPPGPAPAYSQTDLVVGSGPSPQPGDTITVHYTGWLYDPSKPDNKGQQFDSSVGGQPFTFTLRAGQVIQGWDLGFEGMKLGGKRRLILPPHLGYGERGAGSSIPPNATLVFEIQLLDIKPKAK